MKYCNSKRIYETQYEAAEIAKELRNKSKMRPYQCDVCGKWHNATEGKGKRKFAGKLRHQKKDMEFDERRADKKRIKKALTNGYGVFRKK